MKDVLEAPMLRLNIAVFKNGFLKQKTVKREVKVLGGDHDVRAKVLEKCFNDDAHSIFAGNFLPKMEQTQIYGLQSVSFGLEPWGTGVVYASAAGSCDRLVVACPLREAMAAARAAYPEKGPNDSMSIVEVMAFLRSLTQEQLDGLPFKLWFAHAGEESVIYIPPGWCTMSACLPTNSKPANVGVMVSILPKSKETVAAYSDVFAQ
eukprot:1183308-Amphidinium_carterae.1